MDDAKDRERRRAECRDVPRGDADRESDGWRSGPSVADGASAALSAAPNVQVAAAYISPWDGEGVCDATEVPGRGDPVVGPAPASVTSMLAGPVAARDNMVDADAVEDLAVVGGDRPDLRRVPDDDVEEDEAWDVEEARPSGPDPDPGADRAREARCSVNPPAPDERDGDRDGGRD